VGASPGSTAGFLSSSFYPTGSVLPSSGQHLSQAEMINSSALQLHLQQGAPPSHRPNPNLPCTLIKARSYSSLPTSFPLSKSPKWGQLLPNPEATHHFKNFPPFPVYASVHMQMCWPSDFVLCLNSPICKIRRGKREGTFCAHLFICLFIFGGTGV
jgi:hypothetical protein